MEPSDSSKSTSSSIRPEAFNLPVEAQALFLKLSHEAMAQGSALGSMRYLLKLLEPLTEKVRNTVTALEVAEKKAKKLPEVAS